MGVTGFFMLFFVTVHLLGNSTIFIGPGALNTYAEKLHSLGPLVWIFRGFMFLMLAIHVWFGIQLTLENSAANPSKYAVSKKLKATFSGETMIWTPSSSTISCSSRSGSRRTSCRMQSPTARATSTRWCSPVSGSRRSP
jgi:succinate dehydrogenase/fumarate reductase cytochrome b subunit